MEIFVARQPIFNAQQEVLGYELLFRSGLNNFYDGTDGDHATSTVLANSFISIGLNTLTRGKRAFINFTQKLLLDEVVTIFPKDLIAVEILEDINPDTEIIAACMKLKQSGYFLVLDDFVLNSHTNPLFDLADMIKVDILNTKLEDIMKILQRAGSNKVKFLAEKVETQEEFNQTKELGFTYFQGYFFSKPVVISGREVPGYKLNYLRVLQEINQPEVDFNLLEEIIKQDVSLTYKLLNFINSAFFGLPNKIRSIKYALALLGLREARKWLSVVALGSIGKDKPEELLVNSIIRANICELLATKVGLKERSSELFLMGLFSMLDAFLDQPMCDILSKLPIPDDIKHALLGGENHFRDVYDLIVNYEKGDWKNVSKYASHLKLAEDELPEIFIEAAKNSSLVIPG